MSRKSRRRRVAVAVGRQAVMEPPAPTSATWLDPTRLALPAVLVGVAAYRFVALAGEAAPPGADPGNWLAFSHQLFGQSVKAADAVYFPVVPLLLKALLAFLSPLVATKVLGVGCSVIMGVPFYLILRRGCSRILSAALTLALLLAGYQEETLSFGGYPQLLATAFLLFTVYWLMDGLISGRRWPLLLAAASTALVAGTHHFTLVLVVPIALVLAAVLFVQERPGLRALLRNLTVWAGASAVFALPFLPWYVSFFRLMDGNPANANGFSPWDVDQITAYLFEENRSFWLGLIVIAPVLSLVPGFGEKAARIRPAVLGILVGSFAVYAVTVEVRVAQLVEAAAVLSLGLPAAAVEQHLARTRVQVTLRQAERLSLGLAVAALLVIVGTSGQKRFDNAVARYQIVDGSALEALDWLRDHTPPGTRVMANESFTRISYAWWVEGYAERPTYSLISPGYLSFTQEKEQAALAARLIDEDTPPSEVESILQETGIEYIFLDKHTGGRFEPLLKKTPFSLSLENDDFAIVHLSRATAQAAP